MPTTMASYALRTDTGPLELAYGRDVAVNGTGFSYATMAAWSDAERASHGILTIKEPDPVPAGKVSTGSSLQDDGKVIKRVLTLADAPPAPLPVARQGNFLTANFMVDSDGGVSGYDMGDGVSFAFEVEAGVYGVGLAEPWGNATYGITPLDYSYSGILDIKTTFKAPDYFEVTFYDRDTKGPTRPQGFGLTGFRQEQTQ